MSEIAEIWKWDAPRSFCTGKARGYLLEQSHWRWGKHGERGEGLFSKVENSKTQEDKPQHIHIFMRKQAQQQI